MPELSGDDLCQDFIDSGKYPNVPIFFLTAEDGEKERERLKELGAKKVFKKPFSPKTFGELLLKEL